MINCIYMKNFSSRSKRLSRLRESLDRCDSDECRISILMDKVINLQDCLFELQRNYYELLFTYCRPCVHDQF